MTTTAVIGATGFTGRRIVTALDRGGTNVIAIGRDRSALEKLAAAHPGITVRCAAVDDLPTLSGALAGAAVAISTVGPFAQFGRQVVEAAIDARIDLIDISGEQAYAQWVFDDAHRRAQAAGCRLVPCAGFEFFLGDVLAACAGAVSPHLREVHTSYSIQSTQGRGPGTSRGTRQSLAAVLAQPFVVLRQGTRVEEYLAETRRLAWFPRPIGPRHAATIPGTEALSVPRHQPLVQTVTTTLAMPGWKAELAQFLAGVARRRWGRTLVERWAERVRPAPSAARLAATRWAVVAEGIGAGVRSRAWANGTDPYATTADIVVVLAAALQTSSAPPGARAPAEVAAAHELLDALAEMGTLRWGRTSHG